MKNMLKKEKAITLIALIVTIVILLILAGVTIATLTGDNVLYGRAKQAKENYSISEAKEKLTTKLMQLQTEIIVDKGKEASIEDVNRFIDTNSKYYDKEIEDIKDKKENKIIKILGYYFEVDNKLDIIGDIDASELAQTETTYKVNSINENIMNVTIHIKNEIGIQKIIKPDNKSITPTGTKEEIAIDYEVEDGKEYKFKVQLVGSNEEKEYILKANLNAKPEIRQNESNAYPIITQYGIEINKAVNIDYGENTNNYYSLDGGNSWIKYTDEIKIQKECNLRAKTVIEGEITRENSEQISLQLAQDALPPQCYDGDEQTAAGYGKIYIDENMINKSIKVLVTYYTNLEIYNQNNEKIFYKYINDMNSIAIPENSKYIILSVGEWRKTIAEIMIENEPRINIVNKIYPEITANEIKNGYNQVEIEYFSTSEKRLFKIDDNDWQEYKNSKINLELGKKIYAMGIDKNGEETSITEYESKLANDALPKQCYDGDDKTYGAEGIIYIDQSMYSRSIEIKTSYYKEIYIYDQDDKLLDSKFLSGEILLIIPQNTKYIKFKNTSYIYEISIVN